MGFIAFDRFQEIEIEAKYILKEIRSTLDQSQEKLRNIDAEIAKDDPAKAVQVVEEIRADPDSSLVEYAVAQALSLQREGNEEESAEIWRAIANIAEGKDKNIASNAWFSIGFLIEAEKPEEAILAYDRAIRLKPDYAHAYKHRGIVKHFLERYDEAIADYDEAIVDYDEAIRLIPESNGTYINRGNAKIELGRYEDAVADFDEAIRLQPQIADAFFKRGTAKIQLGLQEEARENFEAALELAQNAGDTILLDQAEQALASLD